MKYSKLLLTVFWTACAMSVASVATAQTEGDGFRQRGRALMGLGGNLMGLLNSEDVRNELELVEDQIAELDAVQQSAQQAMRDMFSEMQDLPREDRREFMTEMRGKLQERMKEFEEEANLVLLPHQQTRLKQLTYQSTGRRQGAGGVLANENLLEELGVTDQQREELEAVTAKARDELREKYAKMVRDAEDEILQVLDREQREKYRELIGDVYEFQDQRRGDRGDRGDNQRRGRRGEDRSDFQIP